MKKYVVAAAAMIASFSMSSAANAVVTTIATFSTPSNKIDFRVVNSGNSPNRTTDATFYTTSTATAPSPGAATADFSFTNTPLAAYVADVSASFMLTGSIAKTSPSETLLGEFTQSDVSGSFSFISTRPITVTAPDFETYTYAAGSNLLSGTFTDATLFGSGSAGGVDVPSGLKGTIVLSSDFLDFTSAITESLNLSLFSIAPSLAAHSGPNSAVDSFRASLSGAASSDPAALDNGLAVPEPAS